MSKQVEFIGYKPGQGQKVLDSGPIDADGGVDFVFDLADASGVRGSFFVTEPGQDGVDMTVTLDGAHKQGPALLSMHWSFPQNVVLTAGRHVVHVEVDGPTHVAGKLLLQGPLTRHK